MSFTITSLSKMETIEADIKAVRFIDIKWAGVDNVVLSPPFNPVTPLHDLNKQRGFKLLGINHYLDEGIYFGGGPMLTYFGGVNSRWCATAAGFYSCWSRPDLHEATGASLKFEATKLAYIKLTPNRSDQPDFHCLRVIAVVLLSGLVFMCEGGAQSEHMEILGLYTTLRKRRERKVISQMLGGFDVQPLKRLPKEFKQPTLNKEYGWWQQWEPVSGKESKVRIAPRNER